MRKPKPEKPHAPKSRRRYRAGKQAIGVPEETIWSIAAKTLLKTIKRAPVAAAWAKCICGGQCPCHTGVQLLAVPCPPNCPNIGTRFDGCHRCDCKGTR